MLLGSRVPASLKVFLTAVAIIDDLGAIVIIALFYTEQLSLTMLGGAAVCLGVLLLMNRAGVTVATLLQPVTLGITAGLVAGKAIGVFGATWLMVKVGWAERPSESSWTQIFGISLVCGIGFTMSLFIGGLAFEGQDPGYELRVKLGVLCGSLLAAALGSLVLLKTANKVQ